MTERPHLHLVSAEGANVSPGIQEAVEVAFRWVAKDYPTIDEAQLADWAESLATSMHAQGSRISSPNRYAYAALRGKVRDWLRTGAAQEQSSGINQDLERIGGKSSSFQGSVERKILFEQLQNALTGRDRDILVLILSEKSTLAVAGELKTSQAAARKAIQRVKERIGALLGSKLHYHDGGKQSTVNQRGLAVE